MQSNIVGVVGFVTTVLGCKDIRILINPGLVLLGWVYGLGALGSLRSRASGLGFRSLGLGRLRGLLVSGLLGLLSLLGRGLGAWGQGP